MLRLIQFAVVGGITYLVAGSRAARKRHLALPRPLTSQEHLALTWLEKAGAGRSASRLLIPRTEEDAAALQRLYEEGALLRRYPDGRPDTAKQGLGEGAYYRLRPGAGRPRMNALRARRTSFGIEGSKDAAGNG